MASVRNAPIPDLAAARAPSGNTLNLAKTKRFRVLSTKLGMTAVVSRVIMVEEIHSTTS